MTQVMVKGQCQACGKSYKIGADKVPASGKAACKCEAKGTIVFDLDEKSEAKKSSKATLAGPSAVVTSGDDQSRVAEIGKAYEAIKREIAKNIVGQHSVVEQLLLGIFADGHCLLIGVPGLAKTLLVNSLCEALSLELKRIQFTPDLMPSDITATEVIQDDTITKERICKVIVQRFFDLGLRSTCR